MIHRIDVRTKLPTDAAGEALRAQIQEMAIAAGPISTSRIFLIDSDADTAQLQRAANELLADPLVETAELIHSPAKDDNASRIEVHLKPGVMDPVAASTEMALRDMGVTARQVRTGRAFVIHKRLGTDLLQRIANSVLANGVIESVHFEMFLPKTFEAGRKYQFQLKHIALRQLTDEQLTKLSRDGHLFLSLAEMKAVQTYFRQQEREPTDIELETLAQTWSEHCVHKTLKSGVDVEVHDATGKVIAHRQYKNLIKETIFQSTMELMDRPGGKDFCLSVFVDNAGVIAFDETDAVCFKAETHNHPSAIEPYGGSATGIGGVIRDILGTGLAAKPIANTDVFCVADPFSGGPEGRPLPRGVIHPKRVLQQIVAGVRDYGNRMGIPTVNGAVYFDDRYLGNPLVFCGCVGLIPRNKLAKQAITGDAIVVMGGRTGRDGIHGATFSSAELTDTHADEFSHAVQIGNAITEKKVTDVILQARDRNLFTAITDCGAGGLSSAIGEMGEKTGASVDLEKVPLKYAGLRYDEIWISEAQERMVLAVPKEKITELQKLAAGEDVEAIVIGTFGTPNRELILNYKENEVGRMAMKFLHDGIPMPTRKAIVTESIAVAPRSGRPEGALFKQRLLKELSHPNIASKHWIIRQYDHEVQGSSVIKPLIGPQQIGPSDAAVIRPKLTSHRGIAIGCGMVPHIADPYEMAIASIDEAIRNVISVGADFNRIAILDNFCWPSVDDPVTMGTLVRAAEACRDAARAFGIPFISGKDSLHNQFTNQETGEILKIPNTLLISAIGIVEDVRKCITMDFKLPGGNPVCLVSTKNPTDLQSLAATHRAMSKFIAAGHVAACHDISDGGLAVAAAEMCIASGHGLNIDPDIFTNHDPFTEQPGRYLIELRESAWQMVQENNFTQFFPLTTELLKLGHVQHDNRLMLFNRRMGENKEKVTEMLSIKEMTTAWRGTLDW
jgi:phosphoribosylformylglycinamidine synthase subunit PurSL